MKPIIKCNGQMIICFSSFSHGFFVPKPRPARMDGAPAFGMLFVPFRAKFRMETQDLGLVPGGKAADGSY